MGSLFSTYATTSLLKTEFICVDVWVQLPNLNDTKIMRKKKYLPNFFSTCFQLPYQPCVKPSLIVQNK